MTTKELTACPICGYEETWHESQWGWDYACGNSEAHGGIALFSSDGALREIMPGDASEKRA